MQRRSFLKKLCTACIVTYVSPGKLLGAPEKQAIDALKARFQEPLLADRPQVFWFWMNGHVNKEGITLDLEAMKSAGIGGVFNFDAGISIPKGPVAYLSKEWLDLKRHAIAETKRLGLEYVMHNCPGWSASGGPWITPELAMKQLTWSEIVITGGQSINTQLPTPFHKLNFYRDIAVLAYPSLPSEAGLRRFKATASNGAVSLKALTGEDPAGAVVQPTNEHAQAWLLFAFEEAQEVRFLTFLVAAVEGSDAKKEERTAVELQSSDDGKEFTKIVTISTGLTSELRAGYKFVTYDIAPVKAKYFRMVSAQARRYSQFFFSGLQRLPNFMEKTGNRFMFSGETTSPIYSEPSGEVTTDNSIDHRQIVDLSAFFSRDGTLAWTAPEGSWTVLRFGYTVTGAVNKAAPENGTGLECDKFSKAAIDFHFTQMLDHFGEAATDLLRHGKAGLEIDSYEAGPQTWTQDFPEVFRQRRGYSVLPYLPALTGRVLHTVLHTEQFLWDVRRTQADLMAENYYGRFAELCRQKGFTSYAEPYDKGTFEEMQVGSRVDVTMGEFWYGLHALLQGNRAVERTSRLAASIMHTAGRKIVGAESFTSEPESSRWQEYPFSLKALGDKMFCQGLNKLIIHRFAHQPNPFAKPGMTMGPWGIHFDRTNTWFGVAGGWLRYLSRCQVLLREGWPVKDLLYFTGEEANVYTRVNRDELFPQPPLGFDYDLINADTILNKASIKDGFITLPHGMQYRILVLQDYKRITFRLLQKLRQLVAAGMLLVGQKPAGLLGLGDAKNEAAFKTTADELWPEPYNEKEGHHTLGKGQVYWGASLAPLLEALSLKPDFECSSRSGDAPIQAVHRRSGDTDIYFISNQRRSFEEIVCSFRVKGKQPQIWDPGSGIAYPAVVYEAANEVVRVPVVLEPYGSRFILFRTAGEKEGILTIRKDGETLVAAEPFPVRLRKLFTSVSNNFTIALWAKPEMNIMTKASQHMGNLPHPYTDYYALYPSGGETLYGAGHATAGLTIGRNGVGVWENAVYPKLTLVAEAPVAGWSHIAVVYEEGVPSVYINGSRVAKGSKSASVVHPGVGQAFMSEGASYFNGDRSEPNVWDKALGEEELRILAAEAPTVPPEFPQLPEVAVHNGKPALLLWQNGSYELQRLRSKVSFPVKEIDPSIEIARNWKLLFPPRSGAPHIVLLQALHSLHLHAEDGVKHFSGTVHYQNTFKSNRDYRTGNRRLFLDLGRVEVIAQVTVNGKDLGTLWKRPYLVDISAAVRKGINQLEVKVTNLWPNRLIGDEKVAASEAGASAGSSGFEHLAGTGFETFIGRPVPVLPDWYVQGGPKPDDGKVAFATWQHYTKEDPLLESGLIGPVLLRTAVLKGLEVG